MGWLLVWYVFYIKLMSVTFAGGWVEEEEKDGEPLRHHFFFPQCFAELSPRLGLAGPGRQLLSEVRISLHV